MAEAHQQGVTGRAADTLTIHAGKWAYCPMDVKGSGHKWEDTGGVPIETLRRGTPTIDIDLDVRPRAEPAPRPSAKTPSEAPARASRAPASRGSTARRRAT
ncbi:MAG TPA: hypothetical protein VFM93_03915 [Candidatus Limnocylindria bacterium]|nr:hypothetical protein [Candidatus Limnocylindria bacterium]